MVRITNTEERREATMNSVPVQQTSTLLCFSTRQARWFRPVLKHLCGADQILLCRNQLELGNGEHSVDFSGDVALQAADDLALALALCGAPRAT